MKIDQPFIEGRLIRRYKRFLADVELMNGDVITAHTGNTGAMRGCSDPGCRVWLYNTGNPKRKYIYSWDLVEDLSGNLIGIHTTRANRLVHEAINNGVAEELQHYDVIKPEQTYEKTCEKTCEKTYDKTRTRFDFLLQKTGRRDCFLEVKNVTAKRDAMTAIFPDAKSERAKKHLLMLLDAVEKGYRGVIFFCIRRSDATIFKPADEVDPEYGELLRKVTQAGVEAVAYKAILSPTEVVLSEAIPVVL